MAFCREYYLKEDEVVVRLIVRGCIIRTPRVIRRLNPNISVSCGAFAWDN